MPEPDGPVTATNSPLLDLEAEFAQRVRLEQVGAVDLGDLAHFEHRHGVSSGVGWRQSASSTRAASLNPSVSEMTTWSPSARPPVISTSRTLAAPVSIGVRSAVSPRTT